MDLLWQQFGLQMAHFAITVFTSVVLFAVTWLYFDAWLSRKGIREAGLTVGFFLVSISYLFRATVIEQGLFLQSSPNSSQFVTSISLIGFLSILGSLLHDPIVSRPKTSKSIIFYTFGFGLLSLKLILIGTIAWLYRTKAKKGLEHHLFPISKGFFLLAASELVSISTFWRSNPVIWIMELVRPFGTFWIIEHILLFCASLFFLRWVWSYLFKRFETQLFFVFTSATVLLFFIVTVVFTSLFVKSLQQVLVSQQEIDGKLFVYSLSQLEKTILLQVQQLATQKAVLTSVMEKTKLSDEDQTAIKNLLPSLTSFGFLSDEGISISSAGSTGKEISKALLSTLHEKKHVTMYVTESSGVVPQLAIMGVSSVIIDGSIKGYVWGQTTLDSAFLEGIKKVTQFEVSIYSSNILSATTINDIVQRQLIGLPEKNEFITNTVLTLGNHHIGLFPLVNKTYLGSFQPVFSIEKKPIGMLFVGQSAIVAFNLIGKTIALVFQTVVLLIIISTIPAFILARTLARQAR